MQLSRQKIQTKGTKDVPSDKENTAWYLYL